MQREDEHLEHLGAWRHQVSISRRELAQLAGLDTSTLRRIEVEARPARPKTVRLLAAALGVSPSQLRQAPSNAGVTGYTSA